MKKFFTIILVLGLLLSLVACSTVGTEAEEAAEEEVLIPMTALEEDDSEEAAEEGTAEVAVEEVDAAENDIESSSASDIGELLPASDGDAGEMAENTVPNEEAVLDEEAEPDEEGEETETAESVAYQTAQAYVGRPVEELYAAIGEPTGGAQYATSCLEENADDGMLFYDNFYVWSLRTAEEETVYAVYLYD